MRSINLERLFRKFGRGILEFQAMLEARLSWNRALKAPSSVTADLLRCYGMGVLAPGPIADFVAMPGDPTADIRAIAKVGFLTKEGVVCQFPKPEPQVAQDRKTKSGGYPCVEIKRLNFVTPSPPQASGSS